MQNLLETKDPVALEGMNVALEMVDVILNELLEEIKMRADQVDRTMNRHSLDSTSSGVGSLMRLAIQKQTIQKLREGIPAVIIYGDVTKLRGVVG